MSIFDKRRKKLKKKKKVTPDVHHMKGKDVAPLREKLLKEQGGLCLVCKTPPKIPCLDHHHRKRIKGTGLVRGVLCNSCNVFIAKSENNCMRYGFSQKELPTILRSMADYFERDHLPYLHPSEVPKPKKVSKRSYNKLKTALKHMGSKVPLYPKSGTLTKPLQEAFENTGIKPEYYKK